MRKTLKFECPFCEQSLEVEKSQQGGAINCPSCGKTVQVPVKRPRAFAYFLTAVIGLVLLAVLAATVMIVYILKFQLADGAHPFAPPDPAVLSPFDRLKYEAKQGSGDSQYEIGRKYFFGEGVRRDTGEAVEWLKKAADSGQTEAQAFLGVIYCRGEDGVSRSTKKAAKWLKLAADKGDADSQNLLGMLYETGNGLAEDPGKALDCYDAARRQGDASAKANYVRLRKTLAETFLNRTEDGSFIPQTLFDEIHFTGTARSITVDRLDFNEEGNEIFLLTLYWEGPITKNGYTTIRILLDDQGGRDFAVMDTNGITRDDLSDLAGILIQ
jgi:DNA-directed RNA polymerase subunit RPC12/RpoP